MRDESKARDESKVWIPKLKDEELWYFAQILQQHCRESICNKCIFHCSNRLNVRCILHDGNDPMLWLLDRRNGNCEEDVEK